MKNVSPFSNTFSFLSIGGMLLMIGSLFAGSYDYLVQPIDEWLPQNKTFSITPEGEFIPSDTAPSRFLHGTNWQDHPQLNSAPLSFHAEFLEPGEFVFSVDRVSVQGKLVVQIDGKTAWTQKFITGPGEGPWRSSTYLEQWDIYQCIYEQEVRIPIKAGLHTITLENKGPDWVSFQYFILTKVTEEDESPEYSRWQEYELTLADLPRRFGDYKSMIDRLLKSTTDTDLNYDALSTLELQFQNLQALTETGRAFNFDLMRTEEELIELLDAFSQKWSYFGTKRDRIKRGYRSTIDQTLQPYDIMIPEKYDPGHQYALVVNLHGYEVNIRKWGNFLWADEDPSLDSLKLIRAATYGRRNQYYIGAAEQDILDVLAEIRKCYNIDENRIYLAGASMGGYGTWKLAFNYPDLFAAISPLCGPTEFNLTGSYHFSRTDHDLLRKIYSPINYVENGQHLPARVYHGAVDETVSVEHSRLMVDHLEKLNYPVEYIEYPNIGHSVWNEAEADPGRLEFLLSQTRQSTPDNINHRCFFLRHGKAYWLEIIGKQYWDEFAQIQGQIKKPGFIEIRTENVSQFKIDALATRLQGGDADSRDIVVNGQQIQISTDSSWLELIVNSDGTPALLNSIAKTGEIQKRAGMEGPWLDAEKGPLVIVQGTSLSEHFPRQNEIVEGILEHFGEYDMAPPVMMDMNVLADWDNLITSRNLHLIGGPQDNAVLARISDQLPITFLTGGFVFNGIEYDDTYGLRMIFPNPEFNSNYVRLDIYPATGTFHGIQSTLVADYIIYKLDDDQIVPEVSGFFDINWRLP